MVLPPFRKWNSFNHARKHGKFDIDLVVFMLNTLWTLELANVAELVKAPYQRSEDHGFESWLNLS